MSDLLLTEHELAEYLRCSAAKLRAWRRARRGPAWVRIGRHVRYSRDAVEAYLATCASEPAVTP